MDVLKPFLAGEAFYRRSQWDSASAYYEEALRADSTFAPALRHLASVRTWQGSVGDDSARALRLRAGRHNRKLPRRDSLLVLADSLAAGAYAADASAAFLGPQYWALARRLFGTLERATGEYPDDPAVWYTLGDARYHFGYGPAAVTEWEILDAFDRAIALDSAFAPSYIHAIELALKVGGRPRASRYIAKYLTLDAVIGEGGAGIPLVARLVAATPADSRAVRRLLDSLAAIDHTILWAAAYVLDHWPDPLETAARAAEVADPPDAGRAATDCASARRGWARLLAYRGHLRAARCALGGESDGVLFAELALLGAVPADTAAATFDRWAADWPDQANLATLAIPWWAERRDTARIKKLIERRAASARAPARPDLGPRAMYDTAAAGAYLALARGDTGQAAARFRALGDTLCISCSVLDRLTRARLLEWGGNDSAANRIYSEWRGAAARPTDILFELGRGRTAARLGRRRAAAAAYCFVTLAWARADSELQHYVDSARVGLRRLGAEPGACTPAPDSAGR
jgi:hypothetical protein